MGFWMYQVNDAALSRRQSSCMYSQQSLNPWEQDSAQNGKRMCHSKVKHLMKTGFVTGKKIYINQQHLMMLSYIHYFSSKHYYAVWSINIHSHILEYKPAGLSIHLTIFTNLPGGA